MSEEIMAKITLGIDFGCFNLTIVAKDGFVIKQPNVLAIKKTKDGNSLVAIGEKAQELLGKTTDDTFVVYPVCGGEIVDLDYAKMMLRESLSKQGIKAGVFTKLKVITLVPSGIDEKEKEKYVELFKGVGAKEIICLPKIFATALGENINIGANSAKLIVDIGGGNVECSVINLNTLVCSSSLGIGGRTIDLTIIDYIKQKYGVIIGENTALMLKEQIFSLYESDTAKMDVNGVNYQDNTPVQITVTAHDIYDATHVFFDEVIRVIRATISSLSPEISSDVVRNGIYISGGLAKIPGLDKYFKKRLKVNVFVSYETENVTIKGLSTLLTYKDILDNILANL